jgi:hypothetical protein
MGLGGSERAKFTPVVARVQPSEQGMLGSAPVGEGLFVASSGRVTDEVIMEYIRTQEMRKDDDDFQGSDG